MDTPPSSFYDRYMGTDVEYLQYESGKFSKSRGVGVFGNNVMDSGIPVEVWRYYLLANRPESSDSQFTWSAFAMANNTELLSNLGNFVNRVMKFALAKYGGFVPACVLKEPEAKVLEDVGVLLTSYVAHLEAVKIRQGARIMMEVSARGNLYLQENKLDNALFETQRERCDTVVAVALNLCYLLSALVYPYMPSTCAGILRQLNAPQRKITDTWGGCDITERHQLGKAEYLFKSIDEKKMEECRRLYSGQGPAPEVKKKRGGKKEVVAAVAVEDMTEEMRGVHEKIEAQASVVRELKLNKAEAPVIKEAVDLLLALKKLVI